ncbi:hypothetical protein BdWA1_003047 [Babesia duncani]|uniref:Uncharacterized protein n=1 Tax=Babesia duncani TaxID=323732 RepID=A0AAD9UN37_9APIC|nr:hypothetical protein BdWA1_003047 [Babesia duncani]
MISSKVQFEPNGQTDSDPKEHKGLINRRKIKSVEFKDSNDSIPIGYENDTLYAKLKAIQELTFDYPELENTFMSPSGPSENADKTNIPPGLIVGVLMTAPTGIAGTYMRCHVDPNNANDLFLIQAIKEDDTLHLIGSFKLAFDVYNSTPFPATLNGSMTVDYLMNDPTKLLNRDACFIYHSNPQPTQATNNLKNSTLDFTHSKDPIPQSRSINPSGGNLISLNGVTASGDASQDNKTLHVLDGTIYDAFKDMTLISNELGVITNIVGGLNEVSILVTLNTKIEASENNEILEALLKDCEHGSLTIRCTARDLRFHTMIFGADMFPIRFLPIRVPCMRLGSADVQNENKAKIESIINNSATQFSNVSKLLHRLDLE